MDPVSRLLVCPISGRCTDRLVSDLELREEEGARGGLCYAFGGCAEGVEGQEEALDEPGGERCAACARHAWRGMACIARRGRQRKHAALEECFRSL